jgi:N-acylneuraminate cytidylyltransferase
MKVAVIPARGGSKRIPRKNIRDFFGKPMIAYSIDAARKAGCFDEIIVSTDDDEIARIAKSYGAEVPFMRPAELADDHTPTIPVIQHAIRELHNAGRMVQEVCCIYATAPFLRVIDLMAGLDKISEQTTDYCFAMTKYRFPIQRALRKTANGYCEMFSPSQFAVRSQDLEEAWHDAGQFYWARSETWLSGKPIFGARSCGIELPDYLVQDIDTLDDWKRAEFMYAYLTNAHKTLTTHQDS